MRALVLHPVRSKGTVREPGDALAEAVSLAGALDLDVAAAEVVPLPRARAGTLFGKGKLEELGALIAEREVGLVIIDGPLSPVQQRNLEKAWKAKVLDRTGLILEIFGDRAQTREGVLQVELAHLSYQKSRLVRSWTHLERQRGGFGFLGGPGETQIEADRRALDERIQRIKQALAKVVRTRGQHRKARARVPYPVVALVGYTNAGKSTLFNRLTGSGVLAKDMLFATLDPTMRAIALPDGRRAILSDTVGFISDLPHQLVAAFRATLEEVLEADLILHVRDIAHPESEIQAENVRAILGEMGIGPDEQARMIEVWNKVDALAPEQADALRQVAGRTPRVAAISALTGEGLPALLDLVAGELAEPTREETISLRFDQGRQRAWLFDRKLVRAEHAREDGYDLDVRWTERDRSQYEALG
jgi:GTP-binding protein HflX